MSDCSMEDDDLVNNLPQLGNKHQKTHLESRISICLPSKGLFNAPGDNNCFLNAAVQILWHVNAFRRSFRLLQGHACLENACIFCALKRMFQKFQDSDASALDPDDLRQSMAKAFVDEHRFQLGRMDDAAECFENILHRLHCHIAYTENEDACAAKHCIPHQKFASHILEQVSCKCKATGEPKSYYQFVHYVSASSLAEHFHESSSEDHNVLVNLLKSSVRSGDAKSCPDLKRCSYRNSSKNMTSANTTLINCPDVLTVGVIWDTDSPSSDYITDVFDCFQSSLYLKSIFNYIPDNQYKHLELKVVGVVCYYGKHYVSFFYNSQEEQWIYFDDAHVRKIGRRWSNVKEKCCRSRFQPLLVIYANSSGSPVDISNAPATKKIVSKEMLLSKPKSPSHRKHKRKSKRTKDSKSSLEKGHASPSRSKSPQTNTHITQPTSNDLSTKLKVKSPVDDQNEAKENVKNKFYHNEDMNPAYRSEIPLPGAPQIVKNSFMPKSDKPKNLIEQRPGDMERSQFLENRQRHGSIKKKFEDVFKGIKSTNKQKAKKEILPDSIVLRSSSMDSIFQNDSINSNPYMISKHQFTSQNMLKDGAPPGQRSMMEKHQKTLSNLESNINRSSSYDVLDSASHQHTKKELVMRDSTDSRSSANSSVSNTDLNYRQVEDNLIDFDTKKNTDRFLDSCFTKSDRQSSARKSVQFEFLVNRGERMLQESQLNEKSGDLMLAFHRCSEATRLFRDASKLVDNDSSLVKFVDEKRWSSFHRSEMLQKKVDNFLELTPDLCKSLEQVTVVDVPPERNSSRRGSFSYENPRNGTADSLKSNVSFGSQQMRYAVDKSRSYTFCQPKSAGLSNDQYRLPNQENSDSYYKDLPIPNRSVPAEGKLTYGNTIYSTSLLTDLFDKKTNNKVQSLNGSTKTMLASTEVENKLVNDALKLLKEQKRHRCIQCGWRKVESRDRYCDKCQSEYI